jgi:hypothetical protein
VKGAVVLKDVRVAPDQLVGDGLDRVGDGEGALLRGDLCQEDPFEDVVPDLFFERFQIAPLDRLDDLVRLLEHVACQRMERLLAVPGTPVGSPEGGHDLDETIELRRAVAHGNWVNWVIW